MRHRDQFRAEAFLWKNAAAMYVQAELLALTSVELSKRVSTVNVALKDSKGERRSNENKTPSSIPEVSATEHGSMTGKGSFLDRCSPFLANAASDAQGRGLSSLCDADHRQRALPCAGSLWVTTRKQSVEVVENNLCTSLPIR